MGALSISHFLFADDAMIIGEWSSQNVINMVNLLQCFKSVSGLNVNLQKSSLFGIGVDSMEVDHSASLIGCKSSHLPFVYLGIPVGNNMNRVNNWKPIIDKFHKRLSTWKASTLSIGGRSTLLTSVLGALGTYYMSLFPMPSSVSKTLESIRANFFWGSSDQVNHIHWIAWDSCLSHKSNGGLGTGSLKALNLALIQKWRWRYVHQPHALWAKIIRFIHSNCATHSFFKPINSAGLWSNIIKSIFSLHDSGIIPFSSLFKELGNGHSTLFWHDVWVGNSPLKEIFPRLFHLDSHPNSFVKDKWNSQWSWSWARHISRGLAFEELSNLSAMLLNISLSDQDDKWIWSFGSSKLFTVSDTRKYIDSVSLPISIPSTRWNRYVPKKVNIMIWRALRDRLPTRSNLSKKGLALHSLSCPICLLHMESINHIFWECSFACAVWLKIFSWLAMEVPACNSFSALFTWLDSSHMSKFAKAITESILNVTIWLIWKLRNNIIFGSSNFRPGEFFDSIVDLSFLWFCNRNRNVYFSWANWASNPIANFQL